MGTANIPKVASAVGAAAGASSATAEGRFSLDRKRIRSRIVFAAALGEVVIAWNGLQESLATLFGAVSGNADRMPALKEWHSIRNDRAQRETLRAAVKRRSDAEGIRDDILWLLDSADELSDDRNNVVHAPFWFVRESTDPTRRGLMIPNDFYGNQRAANLTQKDLLKHLRWQRRAFNELGRYARQLRFFMDKLDGPPRPPRPKLPLPPDAAL